MLVASFRSTLSSVYHTDSTRAALGSVSDISELFLEESLRALENVHRGYFVFLAFHPTLDQPVLSYLESEQLLSDSGSRALILFTTTESKPSVWNYTGSPLSTITFIDQQDLPALVALRNLFGDDPPELPGLAVFSAFSENTEVLYFSLADCADADQVRRVVRQVVGLANKAWNGKRGEFSDRLVLRAQKARIPFQATGGRSMAQWLLKLYQWIDAHRGDLLALAASLLP